MYSRMRNRGKSASQIAAAVGKTSEHVRSMLDMHTLPAEIKDLIDRDVVSATLALKTYNELGAEAVEVLKEGVEIVLKAGKSRLTEKRLNDHPKVRKVSGPRIRKAVVHEIVGHVRTIGTRLQEAALREDGSATIELSKDEIEALLNLQSELPDNIDDGAN